MVHSQKDVPEFKAVPLNIMTSTSNPISTVSF